jgi:hypothetical protein
MGIIWSFINTNDELCSSPEFSPSSTSSIPPTSDKLTDRSSSISRKSEGEELDECTENYMSLIEGEGEIQTHNTNTSDTHIYSIPINNSERELLQMYLKRRGRPITIERHQVNELQKALADYRFPASSFA